MYLDRYKFDEDAVGGMINEMVEHYENEFRKFDEIDDVFALLRSTDKDVGEFTKQEKEDLYKKFTLDEGIECSIRGDPNVRPKNIHLTIYALPDKLDSAEGIVRGAINVLKENNASHIEVTHLTGEASIQCIA
jgi:hypothetical protein